MDIIVWSQYMHRTLPVYLPQTARHRVQRRTRQAKAKQLSRTMAGACSGSAPSAPSSTRISRTWTNVTCAACRGIPEHGRLAAGRLQTDLGADVCSNPRSCAQQITAAWSGFPGTCSRFSKADVGGMQETASPVHCLLYTRCICGHKSRWVCRIGAIDSCPVA